MPTLPSPSTDQKLAPLFLLTRLLAIIPFLLSGAALAQDSTPAKAELEKAFADSLRNATLEGTWMPVRGGAVGDEKADRYRIVRAEKQSGNRWHIFWLTRHQGQEIEFPIPVVVEWAGDTAVMILNATKTGGGTPWSARILFHEDVYAGRWWAADGAKAGVVSGTITREE